MAQPAPNAADAALCQALLQRLTQESQVCARTAVETYPGFTLPSWKMIDASKHIDLIAKLLAASGTGGPKTLAGLSPPDLTHDLDAAQQFIKNGGMLRVWHTHLLPTFDRMLQHPTPPGDQTVVLMSALAGSVPGLSACPGHSLGAWSKTYIAFPGLTGPDPRVDVTVYFTLEHSYPVLYKGETLLIGQYLSYFGKNSTQLWDHSIIRVVHIEKTGFLRPGFDLEFRLDRSQIYGEADHGA